ncbi:MAG TPA: sulfite exporter TauE/SafE family protein [Hyphomicrobiaceae bacterium]|nr:sulfite exporter TauE/SafE family protein [Hyphomicrobiaceae bacterium]
MLFGVPLAELAWLAAAILLAGIVTGIFAGLFGIGGGAVIVPVLYEAFRVLGVSEDVRMQLCIGTSLGIIVPTTIRSYLAHRAAGLGMAEVVRAWSPPAVAGVAVGAVAAAYAPAALFRLAFVVIAAAIAAKLLFGRESWVIAHALPGRRAMAVYAALIGLASSLMGISGGSLSTIVLTLYGQSIQSAVATSAGLGVPITLAGSIGYMIAGWSQQARLPPLSIGFVSLVGVAIMAPISSYVAPYGARLAHALPKRTLEIAFGLFLLAAALRFLVSLVSV